MRLEASSVGLAKTASPDPVVVVVVVPPPEVTAPVSGSIDGEAPPAGALPGGAAPPAPPVAPPGVAPFVAPELGVSVLGWLVPVSVPHGPAPDLSHAAGCGALSASTLWARFLPSNVGLWHDFTSRLVRLTFLSAVLSLASCWKPACTRLSGSGE